MSRKFISTIMAAAVALTSFSAVPAAAENRNFEKFVIGAGTLLLLHELANHKMQKQHNTHSQDYKKHHDKKYGQKYGKKYGKKRLAPVPGYCLTRIQTRHGSERILSSRCLNRNYRHAEYLPRSCKVSIKTWRHGHKVTRNGYKPRCLRSKGFRIT
ncbi:hypothetical protein Q4577_15755 [Marinovum sp. 2_MG-2023]|uniref:hypothetical protein n=1 Tax=unclassified Marinovum TaxID=2647166 RepID=UPI0026E3DD12|nr:MULTISPECIES: hypothetical protein [unclassified Marinovum]MDO6731489.1 hypothetical protein [Marinovum sp. 2_MG-2023]MDO6780849.1 hypothetical protein [Marinovum sp. 1_MG-2023]